MKTLTVIYTGQDTDAARALAASLREGGNSTLCVDGFSDIGEIVPCDRVVVMDDVPDWRREKIAEAYPGKVDVSEAKQEFVVPVMPPVEVAASMYDRPLVTAYQENAPRPRGRPRKIA
jgi:hypothetical protein